MTTPSDAPRTLGKYQLQRLLARGGMGEVYLARLPGELGFEKLLVVKTIRADLAADPRFVELFATEAKTAVGLSHPNITPIYELGRAEDGTLYTAMGWVDGPSLQRLGERLRELDRPLELGAALFIVREVLDGLAHAHSHDRARPPVVHRDVTPRNLLVDRSGRVQIVDFGIAKPANAEVLGVMGSVGYMAPEQARGETVDPRADVFSVGCVLYELLTRARAFPREGVWMAPSLAGLPAQLQPLLERALALDPQGRFADAEQFLRAIGPLLAEHAPAFASRDLAAIVRELFPEGWQAESDSASGSAQTPATGLTGPVQTFATRLRVGAPSPSPSPSPGEVTPLADPDPGPGPTLNEATHAPAPWRGRGSVVVGAVAITTLLAGTIGYLVARSQPPSEAPAQATEVEQTPPPTDREPAPKPKPNITQGSTPAPTQPRLAPEVALSIHPADAQVLVDGRALLGPPYRVTLDGDSPRALEIRHDDHHTITLELDPRAPPASPVEITLAPLGLGTLSVIAPTVSWAEVWLDGAKLGTTPLTDKAVREGRHKLEIRCTAAVCGEQRVLLDRNVRIRAGRPNKFSTD